MLWVTLSIVAADNYYGQFEDDEHLEIFNTIVSKQKMKEGTHAKIIESCNLLRPNLSILRRKTRIPTSKNSN
jgi:hypothetical protein